MKKTNKVKASVLALVAGSVWCGLTILPAFAQLQLGGVGVPTAGGLFGSSPVVQIGRASKALVEYYQKYGHLPKTQADLSQTLKFVNGKLTGQDESSAGQPISDGEFSALGQVMIALDSGLAKASIDDLRKNPPANWQVSQGRIVVFITGTDQFIIWYSASDGKPAVDALGQAIILRQECSTQ